jgi:hypothetical protein
MEKGAVNTRLEAPTIDGVKQTGEEEQAVTQITERLQSNARITRPKRTDTETFSKITIRTNYNGWGEGAIFNLCRKSWRQGNDECLKPNDERIPNDPMPKVSRPVRHSGFSY